MILLIRKFAFLITSLSLFLSLFLVPSMGLFNPVYLEPPAPCSVSASWCRVLCSCDVERPSKVRQLISQTIQFKILVCVRYIGFPIKILKFNIFYYHWVDQQYFQFGETGGFRDPRLKTINFMEQPRSDSHKLSISVLFYPLLCIFFFLCALCYNKNL